MWVKDAAAGGTKYNYIWVWTTAEAEVLTAIAPPTKLALPGKQPAFMGNFDIRAGNKSHQENISLGKELSFALFKGSE